MLRENKQSQGTIALFLWFAFFNAQLMFLLLLFIYWKLNFPGGTSSGIVLWRAELIQDPLVLALMMMTMVMSGLGLGLGFRYFSAVRTVAETPGAPKVGNTLYILALVLCEMPGLHGVMMGFLRQPATVGMPFILVSMALITVLFPSGGRFPKPR